MGEAHPHPRYGQVLRGIPGTRIAVPRVSEGFTGRLCTDGARIEAARPRSFADLCPDSDDGAITRRTASQARVGDSADLCRAGSGDLEGGTARLPEVAVANAVGR